MKNHFQLTKTDLSTLRFLLGNMNKEFSMKAISQSTEKSYPAVRESVMKLKKDAVVNVREINPTQSLCSVNIGDGNNMSIFSYVEFVNKKGFFSRNPDLKTIADDVLNRIEGNSFSMLFFGSHVRGGTRPSSDVDILFLIPSSEYERKIAGAVSGASRLTNKGLHAIYMTYEDFFGSLGKKELNLPREVVENHIIVYGAEAFYRGLALHG